MPLTADTAARSLISLFVKDFYYYYLLFIFFFEITTSYIGNFYGLIYISVSIAERPGREWAELCLCYIAAPPRDCDRRNDWDTKRTRNTAAAAAVKTMLIISFRANIFVNFITTSVIIIIIIIILHPNVL